ncbi:hypothetical protein R4Z10_09445 [Niallia sp. XMNu-256]|uniref:hypothetical protein n=1 Tax=Niallia sp. XMNu-256 TaxID=3082444 RepID=UPI0030CEFDE7
MYDSLSLEERNELLSLVTPEQREFLENNVKRGRTTIFARFMTSEKVQAIRKTDEIELTDEEKEVVGWKIVNYHDYGSRIGTCACNRSIRYEFTVEHTITKKRITYSKEHLAEFLSLKIRDIDEVMNQIWEFDLELDELLIKIRDKDYGYEVLDVLNGKIEIPKDIQEHVDHQIPLLDNQLKRLVREAEKIEEEEARESRRKQRENAKRAEKEQMEESLAQEKFIHEQREAYQKAQKLVEERLDFKQKERQEREQKLVEEVQTELPVHSTIGEMAYILVKHGVSSATKISHMIRDHYHADKELSKGIYNRPRMYPEVLRALIKYSEQGKIFFDKESSSVQDCIFIFNQEEQVEEHTMIEMQTTLF